ncbi:MAG: hypothetical protein JXB47_12245 [Anaerolineae bacterium]|nr:hypothetical protein [Anaerolineae bacterium]
MVRASYTVQIDWDNDGDFSDTGEDISDYVVEAEWRTGCAAAYDRTAAPGWLKLIVDNRDRRFAPEYAPGPLYGDLKPMRYVRVQATYDGATYTLFYGYLWRIAPGAGRRGEQRATLHGIDPVALLEDYPLGLELLENKRADEIIDAIVQAVAWPPALNGYWLLGVPGHMELGQTTRLGGASLYRDFETGRETFAHAGDTWYPETTTALEAIRQTCASEYGKFHFTREGKARFLDRHWPQQVHSTAAALDDTMAGLVYHEGMDSLYNEIIVRMDPRVEGTAGSVLWTKRSSALRLAANSERTIRAVFIDDEGRRHGATTVITPAPVTDFTANGKNDGAGADYTSDSRLSVSVAALATGAAITFKWGQVNGAGAPAPGPIYITSLQLRGTPLKAFNPEEFAASDGESISRYQRRRLMADAPLLNDPVTGYAMARYLLMMHKDPAVHVAAVTLIGDVHIEHILACTLYDVVEISETQTALSSAEYFIIAEHHKLAEGGARHACTWMLEPLPPFKAWLLGVAGRDELGQNTKLGF